MLNTVSEATTTTRLRVLLAAYWRRAKLLVIQIILGMILRLLYTTYRFKVVTGAEHLAAADTLHPAGSYVLALWHQGALGGVMALAWRGIAMLVSPSRDGDITTFVGRWFGFQGIRGSSSRGGAQALRQIFKQCQRGLKLGITVDGPRGPARQVKPGIAHIAGRCQVPVLPLAIYAPQAWYLSSWDRLVIPKPFSTVYVGFGAPVVYPKKLAAAIIQEEIRQSIEALEVRLNRCARELP